MVQNSQTISNRFSIDFCYEIQSTRDVLAVGNATLANTVAHLSATSGPAPCLMVIDRGLAEATPKICENAEAYANAYSSVMDLRLLPCVLPGGEATKNGWETPTKVIDLCRTAGVCKHSFIIAFGGGAFLDAVGFAAATFHRGIRLIRLPTTVLSQNDSGVGVKCGINLAGSKNLIGAFAPPAAVINDSTFLQTLSPRDWIAGIAEAYKVGAICDRAFLDWLDAHGDRLSARDLDTMEALIAWCATLHCTHITQGGDPFEFGSSRPLDFGHWAGHKLEMMTKGEVRHGEAVAVGIALDLLYAADQGFIAVDDAHWVIQSMAGCGLPVWHDALEQTDPLGYEILQGIEEFRKHLGGQLHITFPSPLGKRLEVNSIDQDAMLNAVATLKALVAENG